MARRVLALPPTLPWAPFAVLHFAFSISLRRVVGTDSSQPIALVEPHARVLDWVLASWPGVVQPLCCWRLRPSSDRPKERAACQVPGLPGLLDMYVSVTPVRWVVLVRMAVRPSPCVRSVSAAVDRGRPSTYESHRTRHSSSAPALRIQNKTSDLNAYLVTFHICPRSLPSSLRSCSSLSLSLAPARLARAARPTALLPIRSLD